MSHEHTDQIKNAVDISVMGIGSLTGFASLLSDIINPVLTALVLVTTIIYTVIRIRNAIKKKVPDETK